MRNAAKTCVFSLCAVSTLVMSASFSPARADPVQGYIFNNNAYTQTDANPPTYSGAFFNIGANNAASFSPVTATFGPSATVVGLSDIGGGAVAYASPLYANQGALHAQFPFGSYVIAGPNSSSTLVSIPYTTDHFANDVPYLTNFNSLNGLDPGQASTFSYNGFTADPLASEALIYITIFNAATNALIFNQGIQPTGAGSHGFGANTFAANTTYGYEIDFSTRFFGQDDVTGIAWLQGFDVRTDGTFTTGAVPEPSTWAMLLLGFAGLGLMAARRRGAVGAA